MEIKEYSKKKRDKKRFKAIYEEGENKSFDEKPSYKRQKFDYVRNLNSEDEE